MRARPSDHIRRLIAVLACAAPGALAGCASSMTTGSGIFDPYSGTKLDAYVFNSAISSPGERIAAGFDFPFSLVLDTALLIVTLPVNPDRLLDTSSE